MDSHHKFVTCRITHEEEGESGRDVEKRDEDLPSPSVTGDSEEVRKTETYMTRDGTFRQERDGDEWRRPIVLYREDPSRVYMRTVEMCNDTVNGQH